MSLRWRFALIFAAGTIVATILVAATAMWTTARSLESEIDQSLFGRIDITERILIPNIPGGEVVTLRAFAESVSGRFDDGTRSGASRSDFPGSRFHHPDQPDGRLTRPGSRGFARAPIHRPAGPGPGVPHGEHRWCQLSRRRACSRERIGHPARSRPDRDRSGARNPAWPNRCHRTSPLPLSPGCWLAGSQAGRHSSRRVELPRQRPSPARETCRCLSRPPARMR